MMSYIYFCENNVLVFHRKPFMDLSFFTTVPEQMVLFVVFIIAVLIQLLLYLGYYSRLSLYKKNVSVPFTPPVSVIVCARNEEENLARYLPLVLEQDYPDFEVIAVNDCSYDNTADILKELSEKYKHLKIVTIKETENHEHGKKVAVMMGIKGSNNECLVFTDADCKPNSKDWLRSMAAHFSPPETEIVLGYGGYEKQNGFLNKMIRFDTFMIALQYLSFALAGKTYMGVGRNLAYKKSLFFKMKGFASHYHIPSGDDDLFVNEAATKHNSKIEISIDSHTISKVKTTLKSWIVQKRRHIITFKYYNTKSKLMLSVIGISQYLFFLLFIMLLILQFQPILILSLFALRILAQAIIFVRPMSYLCEKDLIYIFPVIEFVLLFMYPAIAVSNFILRKINWR
jgi:glycosyltransferase involved in cell wall biosynthesis